MLDLRADIKFLHVFSLELSIHYVNEYDGYGSGKGDAHAKRIHHLRNQKSPGTAPFCRSPPDPPSVTEGTEYPLTGEQSWLEFADLVVRVVDFVNWPHRTTALTESDFLTAWRHGIR